MVTFTPSHTCAHWQMSRTRAHSKATSTCTVNRNLTGREMIGHDFPDLRPCSWQQSRPPRRRQQRRRQQLPQQPQQRQRRSQTSQTPPPPPPSSGRQRQQLLLQRRLHHQDKRIWPQAQMWRVPGATDVSGTLLVSDQGMWWPLTHLSASKGPKQLSPTR